MLCQPNWDRQRIIDLFAVIDWLLRLPQELEERLWGAVMELEQEQENNMSYVPSVERIGLRRGLEQGRKEGLQGGSRIGHQEGRKEGEATPTGEPATCQCYRARPDPVSVLEPLFCRQKWASKSFWAREFD